MPELKTAEEPARDVKQEQYDGFPFCLTPPFVTPDVERVIAGLRTSEALATFKARCYVDELVMNKALLKEFPDHFEAGEMRRAIARIVSKAPELDETADAIVATKYAGMSELDLFPERCPKCSGTGDTGRLGKNKFCGCPAGATLARVDEARRLAEAAAASTRQRTPQLDLPGVGDD